MTVLQENVEHHIEEEEVEMFKEARKVLDTAETKQIAKEFQADKKQWLETEEAVPSGRRAA